MLLFRASLPLSSSLYYWPCSWEYSLVWLTLLGLCTSILNLLVIHVKITKARAKSRTINKPSTRTSPRRDYNPNVPGRISCEQRKIASAAMELLTKSTSVYLTQPTSAFTFITRRGLTPEHSHMKTTPWSVFQDGSFVPDLADFHCVSLCTALQALASAAVRFSLALSGSAGFAPFLYTL